MPIDRSVKLDKTEALILKIIEQYNPGGRMFLATMDDETYYIAQALFESGFGVIRRKLQVPISAFKSLVEKNMLLGVGFSDFHSGFFPLLERVPDGFVNEYRALHLRMTWQASDYLQGLQFPAITDEQNQILDTVVRSYPQTPTFLASVQGETYLVGAEFDPQGMAWIVDKQTVSESSCYFLNSKKMLDIAKGMGGMHALYEKKGYSRLPSPDDVVACIGVAIRDRKSVV
jgi:hypothetical protein